MNHESTAATVRAEYVCPMHPQIVRSEPGNCPICGMTLEPRTISATPEENRELTDMTKRFWISLALTIPLVVIGMGDLLAPNVVEKFIPAAFINWIELILATPVVLWG